MKVCYIGMCGHSGQVHETLRALAKEDRVTFDAAFGDAKITFSGAAPGSREEAPGRWFGDEMPYFSDYREMLDETKPELAVVSPVYRRTASVILACARRGIHVIAEKPIAHTMEELSEVKQAVRENGIRFTAMHFLRFEPAFQEAGQLVRAGRIGEVRLITAQKSYKYGTRPAWFSDRSLYGGTIPWVGIHMIDMASWFTGKRYRTVRALQYGSPEKACLMQYELEGEILASMNLDYLRPQGASTHGDDRIRIAGTEGVIEVRNDRIFLLDRDGEKEWSPAHTMDGPDLVREFVSGRDPIPLEELYHITETAIRSQEAADSGELVRIG